MTTPLSNALTLDEFNKLTKIIMRFVKEDDETKTNYKPSESKLNFNIIYMEHVNMFENALYPFLTKNFPIIPSKHINTRFINFIKQYLQYDTEELFEQYLNTKNLTTDALLQTWDVMKITYKQRYSSTLYYDSLIKDFKPYLLGGLIYLFNFENNDDVSYFKTLSKDWFNFYASNQKLK